jgi:Fe-S-cluster-containing dehydrogenase component
MLIDQARCAGCRAEGAPPCTEGCIGAHNLPRATRVSLGTCVQCDPAPCLEACPADAIAVTDQGAVEIDQELCIGCQFCVDACPNQALMYVDPYWTDIPPYGVPSYTPGAPSGALPYTVAKCTMCTSRLLNGQMPICAEACPEGAVWVGNLDRNTATDGHQVVRLAELLGERPFTVPTPGPRVIFLN